MILLVIKIVQNGNFKQSQFQIVKTNLENVMKEEEIFNPNRKPNKKSKNKVLKKKKKSKTSYNKQQQQSSNVKIKSGNTIVSLSPQPNNPIIHKQATLIPKFQS